MNEPNKRAKITNDPLEKILEETQQPQLSIQKPETMGRSWFNFNILNFFSDFFWRAPSEESSLSASSLPEESSLSASSLPEESSLSASSLSEESNTIPEPSIMTIRPDEPDFSVESEDMMTIKRGLTPITRVSAITGETNIRDCYTVFLVKIEMDRSYTIHIVHTLVIINDTNLEKLKNLIALRVIILIQKYKIQHRCFIGVIDCQLSKLNHEGEHQDSFNLSLIKFDTAGNQSRPGKLIYDILTNSINQIVLLKPSYAMLEFFVPKDQKKYEFTRLLTAIYGQNHVLVRILSPPEKCKNDMHVVVTNLNNKNDHSQPPLFSSDEELIKRLPKNIKPIYRDFLKKTKYEVEHEVIRRIRRLLLEPLDPPTFERLVINLSQYLITFTVRQDEVDTLYSRYVDESGISCAALKVPEGVKEIAGGYNFTRHKQKKYKRRTHKLRTKKRKTKKHASRKRMTKRSKIK